MHNTPAVANRSSRQPKASCLSAAFIKEPKWCFLLFPTDNKCKIQAKNNFGPTASLSEKRKTNCWADWQEGGGSVRRFAETEKCRVGG